MRRPITGFATDEVGDWTALLSCGHRQHVRHDPPFFSRPWVGTPEGRASRLGEMLDCVRCDALELPNGCVEQSRTPSFTDQSMPPALRDDHATAPGVWGRIVVEEGRLRYQVPSLGVDVALDPFRPGIVVPEVPHAVTPLGRARFHVEFLRVTAHRDA